MNYKDLFGEPPYHLVAISGGKDSTALALALREKNPDTNYQFYCTPTGNELPPMFDWWKRLGVELNQPIIPIMEMSLEACIRENNMIPNFRARFCTRQIKIEPAHRMMQQLADYGEVNHYVGLRADEEGRVGGIYDDITGIKNQFPFKEWGWGLKDVWGYLQDKGLSEDIPARTDCALCYHQRIGEWWDLWSNYPDEWQHGEEIEEEHGHTFRSPGRDSWPLSMKGLRQAFEAGRIPKARQNLTLFSRGTMEAGQCRVCSL